ncbi:hypothetical protein [Consotaella salsifontis]|uniref:TIGR02588 family protein n=1 Tax=Consotaella salsifontis TaxID=1365950 RepID=A0A1T4L0Z6_9HYPH|nr:hypothetical protein [Consotaella salsifontis]SJZ48375.1 TIGR02588 family protein [Consotaella salsifontis]
MSGNDDEPQDDRETEAERQEEQARPRKLEWIVGGLSAVLVAAMVGAILFQAIMVADDRPELAAEILAMRRTEAGLLVDFKVVNRGDGTAAEVDVRGRVSGGGEDSHLMLDYVPARGEAKASFLFPKAGEDARITITPTGYSIP